MLQARQPAKSHLAQRLRRITEPPRNRTDAQMTIRIRRQHINLKPIIDNLSDGLLIKRTIIRNTRDWCSMIKTTLDLIQDHNTTPFRHYHKLLLKTSNPLNIAHNRTIKLPVKTRVRRGSLLTPCTLITNVVLVLKLHTIHGFAKNTSNGTFAASEFTFQKQGPGCYPVCMSYTLQSRNGQLLTHHLAERPRPIKIRQILILCHKLLLRLE